MIIKKKIELRKRICMPGVGYLSDHGIHFGVEEKPDNPLSEENVANHIMNLVNGAGGKYISHYIKNVEEYDHGLPDREWSGHKTKQGYEITTLHVLMEVDV